MASIEDFEMMKAWVKKSLPLVDPPHSASNNNPVESEKVMKKVHSSKKDKVKTKRIKVPKETENACPTENPISSEKTEKKSDQTKTDKTKSSKKEHTTKKDKKTKKKKVKSTGFGVWEETGTVEEGGCGDVDVGNNTLAFDVKHMIQEMEDLDEDELYEEGNVEEEEKEEWEIEYEKKRKEKRRIKREEQYLNQNFVHLGQSGVVVPTTDDPTTQDRNMERDRDMIKLYGSTADHILSMEAKIRCGYQTAIDRNQPQYWPVIPINFKV